MCFRAYGNICIHNIRMKLYTFHQSDRMGLEDSTKTQDEIQSANYFGYMTGLNFPTDHSNDFVQFASEHHFVPKGTKGTGINMERIDDDTLLTHKELTKDSGKITLQSRMFNTVPYLGRGSVDSSIESSLIHGETSRDKKSEFHQVDMFNQHKKHPESQAFEEELTSKMVQQPDQMIGSSSRLGEDLYTDNASL